MPKRKISIKSITYMYYLATIMILFSVAIGIVVQNNIVLELVYLLGSILYFIIYLIKPKEESIRLRRLDNMNALAGTLLILSAIFRLGFFSSLGSNLWYLFLSLAVVFMIYSLIIMLFIKEKPKYSQNKNKYAKK